MKVYPTMLDVPAPLRRSMRWQIEAHTKTERLSIFARDYSGDYGLAAHLIDVLATSEPHDPRQPRSLAIYHVNHFWLGTAIPWTMRELSTDDTLTLLPAKLKPSGNQHRAKSASQTPATQQKKQTRKENRPSTRLKMTPKPTETETHA
jgi:hypothetical protein